MTQEVEQDVAPEVEVESEFDYESAARQEGWVSKEEWVEAGKPETVWKPAKDFYEAGQQILPIIQAKNKRLQQELETLKNKVEKMGQTHDMTLKMQREAWEKELKSAKAEAIRQGDGDKVNQIDDQLTKLRQQPSAQEFVNPDAQMALNEFMSQNDWYGMDEDMTVYADAYAARLRQGNPNLPARELLTKVTAKTRDAFKFKFQKKVATVEPASRSSAKPSKRKDYDALPADAKQACDRFLDNIPATQKDAYRQKYVEQYYAQE